MKYIISLFIIFQFSVIAQELDARVTINYEQLPTQQKERLENFKMDVENYLNNTKFTDINWDGPKIVCNFNIFFTRGTAEMRYAAQAVITSQRPIYNSESSSLMLNVFDTKWDFTYEQGQAMYFVPSAFRPLVSFLDFYAYVIIGIDFDSYGPDALGGNDFFNKAIEIAVRGGSSSFSEGWALESTAYNRRTLVEELMNANFQQFRIDLMNYHYNGLDIYQEDKIAAQENIIELINNIDKKKDKINPRSVLMRVFFDTKAKEIIDYLKDYPDKSIFETLKRIDYANISKYDAALE
jgi:hypothetical protein